VHSTQRGHHHVEARAGERQRLGRGVGQLDRNRGGGQLGGQALAHRRVGLAGDDLARLPVEGQVGAGARADLQHPAAEITQQGSSALSEPAVLERAQLPVVQRREDAAGPDHGLDLRVSGAPRRG
jgi:hypothetical protein